MKLMKLSTRHLAAVLLFVAVLCSGCSGRCPEGQALHVWQVNGVTQTACR